MLILEFFSELDGSPMADTGDITGADGTGAFCMATALFDKLALGLILA